MYIPHSFRNENTKEVLDFIQQNSFAILVSGGVNTKILATHIPLQLDKKSGEKYSLVGHISKANPQWKNFTDNEEILVIFNGPHSYVSSSWYDHENVPTWNYIAVHVYGKVSFIEGERLLSSLTKLVDKYEKKSEKPVSVHTMSPDFLKKEIKGIVGIEIEITEIQTAYKLSQNRDDKNHSAILSELRKQDNPGAHQVADEMEKNRSKKENQ